MKKLKSWISPKVYVKNPAIHGKGLFAKKPIRKGEIVSKYGGWRVNGLLALFSHIFVGDFDWQITKNRWV